MKGLAWTGLTMSLTSVQAVCSKKEQMEIDVKGKEPQLNFEEENIVREGCHEINNYSDTCHTLYSTGLRTCQQTY